ncbi:TetR/AcrR family transcriptional regulator [Bacillus sp. AFS002410]|uniref:TetR/AcrR family transcriptional regulator n=1 Tax=Bacillus sp. AFS002410 TaxID=2033481 RepID=UPI0015CF2F85|nr:helix-turn-helix domain-containing protein [Bacillus sp. AFS002410]
MMQKNEDPRITRSRNLIIDAFTELISEKDLQNIYVKEIANRANINRATFYRHFANKEELYKYYRV